MNQSTSVRHVSWWLAAVGVAAMVVAGCSDAPVPAPTAFVAFNIHDGTFACEYPQDWEKDSGGKRGPVWATFQSGPAEIRMRADVSGSLQGSIVGSSRRVMGLEGAMPAELEPVHEVHTAAMDRAAQNYDSYEEVGQPAVLDVSLGPARVSEFTAATTFGAGLHGYRATVLGHDKRVEVFCVCPESDWQTLQPAFDHVLGTLRRGEIE